VTGPVKGRAASSGSYPLTGPASRRLHGAGWRNGGTATLITCNHLKLAATHSGRQANSGKDWLSRQWREHRTGRGLRPSEGRGHRFESCRVHDIRAARQRGEETGLTDEEIAFYDALAANTSARDMMGEPALRLIAHELMQTIKTNVTVDWVHRDSARANIRRLVKRILRKYGYPPDLQDLAVQNVLQQAEALSSQFTET
jgi:hypothetical protein